MNPLNSHSFGMVYYAFIRTNVLVIQQDRCTVRYYDKLIFVVQMYGSFIRTYSYVLFIHQDQFYYSFRWTDICNECIIRDDVLS